MHLRAFAGLMAVVLAAALPGVASAQRRAPTTFLVGLDERPPEVTEVRRLAADCPRAGQIVGLQFGRGGETLWVSCGSPAPLGGFPPERDNVNARAQFMSQMPDTSLDARIFRVSNGALVLHARTDGVDATDLLPIVRAMGAAPWIAGTGYEEQYTPYVFAAGPDGVERRLSPLRSQIISSSELGDGSAAILYKAWTHPSQSGAFPETFLARIDTATGAVLSNNELALPESAGNFVIGASVTTERATLFYRVMGRAPTQADFYGGSTAPVQLMRGDFGFDGAMRSAPEVVPHADAAWTLPMPDGFLLVQGAAEGCPNAVAAVVADDGAVRRCFRRSQRDQPSDNLIRRRPTAAEQYSYEPILIDDGRYVAVVGLIGPDDMARDPDIRTTAHIFESARGRYMGSLSGRSIAFSIDAPLIATTTRSGEVTVWRLER